MKSLLLLFLFSSSLCQGQQSKKNESTIGILKNQTIRPCDGARANDSNCAVHVFRVVLSSKPSDNTTEPVNRDKIIFANAKKNHELSREIAGKIPKDLSESMRNSMKSVIENDGFFLRETEPEHPKIIINTEGGLMSPPSPSPIPPPIEDPLTQSVIGGDGRFLPFIPSSFSHWWILILAVGIILGVLSTVVCILLIEYRTKPMLDRSSQMSFRKWSGSSKETNRVNGDGERLIPVVIPNYYTPEYRAPPPPLITRSVSTTASSSHPNYVNAFSPLDNQSLAMAYGPPPPLPRGREGRYVRRGLRNQGHSYEMQLYNNVNDGNESRGRSSTGSIR